MQFREARPDDHDRLRDLERGLIAAERAFDRNLRTEDVAYYDLPSLIADPAIAFWVVEDEGALVACAFASIRDSKPTDRFDQHAYLNFVYVAESHRGRGLARQLIDRLIAWVRARGVLSVRLDVYNANAGARALYDSLGFEPRLLEMRLDL